LDKHAEDQIDKTIGQTDKRKNKKIEDRWTLRHREKWTVRKTKRVIKRVTDKQIYR
jgi:hypothetical protein